MSHVLRDRKAGSTSLIGLALALGGLLLLARGAVAGAALLAVGVVVEFTGFHLHDNSHRRRGEEPHAMWGKGDRNKPDWLKR